MSRKPAIELATRRLGGESILELMDEGSRFGYSEIFAGPQPEKFVFEYEGRTWIAHDHYCMNPDCRCSETLVSFIEYIEGKQKGDESFAVTISLKDSSFHAIEKAGASNPPSSCEAVVVRFIEGVGKGLELLNTRDARMKERGRELREAERETSRSLASPGRNDPCPCGSGKKYKKCCGR
jgi:hypothetical protein